MIRKWEIEGRNNRSIEIAYEKGRGEVRIILFNADAVKETIFLNKEQWDEFCDVKYSFTIEFPEE